MFSILGALLLLVSIGWLLVVIVRSLFKSQRPKAKKHLKWILCTFILSIGMTALDPKEAQESTVTADTSPTVPKIEPATEKNTTQEADKALEWKREADRVAKLEQQRLDEEAAAKIKADKDASEPAGKLSASKEFLWIRNNQRILLKKLKDPDSAKFENEYVSYKAGGPIVCGTVNSKNSFGGYTGPERYIGGGKTIGVFLASEVSDFKNLWKKLC